MKQFDSTPLTHEAQIGLARRNINRAAVELGFNELQLAGRFPTQATLAHIRHQWGFDQPVYVRYVKIMGLEPPVLVAKTPWGFPAWSPDGRFIAFIAPGPSGKTQIARSFAHASSKALTRLI